MTTLLDQARIEVSPPTLYEEELLDLAIAWLRGEVRSGRVARVLGVASSAVGTRLAVQLKKAVVNGKLRVERVEKVADAP